VVGSQGEADVICSLLRAHGIRCDERTADVSAGAPPFGGWREILVRDDELEAARLLLATGS